MVASQTHHMNKLPWKKIGIGAAVVVGVTMLDAKLAAVPVIGPVVVTVSGWVRKIPVIGPMIPRL